MALLLRMPEISANMVEAVLSEWPLAENSSFSAGDPIATVETDKAVVDVPAETDGVLLRTLVEPGKSVTVGTPMAVLAAPGEDVGDLDALVERLTGAPGGSETGRAPASTMQGPASMSTATAGATQQRDGIGTGPARVFASPLARRIAKENGLQVGDIRGTGP